MKKRNETLWKKAKAAATQLGKADNYRHIMGVYRELVTLDSVVPTRGNEDLIDTINELRECLESFILDMLVPECADPICGCSCENYAWVSTETLNSDVAIVRLRGLKGQVNDLIYAVSYTRTPEGDFVFSPPVLVEEQTTYVPILAAPPTAMSRAAVLCEMTPVHAPPADGLVRGSEIQLLRSGPLHDIDDGKFVLDVTDELCTGIVASAAAAGFGVPIDFGHALYRAQAEGKRQDEAPLFGRIVGLEARPGQGLWGAPEWTPDGVALIKKNPGIFYISPTLMGQPHDPNTGEPMPGRNLHSVSITPTPRQNDLTNLALDRSVKNLTPCAKGVSMDKFLIYALACLESCR